MSKFIESSESRETSVELMEAILYVAGSEDAAERVWEDPTAAEALAIWERVTNCFGIRRRQVDRDVGDGLSPGLRLAGQPPGRSRRGSAFHLG